MVIEGSQFDVFFKMITSSLYFTHAIIRMVSQSRQYISNADQGVIPMPHLRAPSGSWVKKEADFEYPFEHCEVNYNLNGVSINLIMVKIQACFLTLLPERKETTQVFHPEANGDFETVEWL
jgi:hypothetical protein